ncbi:GNAT family N-acetyltransferase [Pelagimonas varians]|uniref:Acetyltransferase (GNAT) family protein n=1 Tax=Pelagimonas varians TaxID=696760 RepID=A0A238KMC3_9RHOB|nr:GNAT family N-acetyltransferase [Pelagimonas varians]PYG29235.1 ribosomal protein S18 acetylase RimI-like enzyme [Pelagimonas varians]SMX43206.1 Acetyltransferase (GNAT) family protein [Pelagimonas varians]
MTINMRDYHTNDAASVAALISPVFRAGDTYAVDADMTDAQALAYWTGGEKRVFVAEDDGQLLGTYYVVRNFKGGGSHVCNCGYITGDQARGKGLARLMLAHSLETAKSLGFRAMQYNSVIATNTRAIDIWTRAGFDVIGRLPEAFLHPVQGYVDALVMYRKL